MPINRCFFFLLLLTPNLALAAPPKIGLVLSGGGARGLAHIGVLRALEEQHIRVDAIAGTSMGAIIGALYASGKSTDEIEHIALTMNWSQLFADLPPRDRLSFRRKQDSRQNLIEAQLTLDDGIIHLPKGAAKGQNLQIMLQQLFANVSDVTDFDRLRIPFRAVAADLATGDPVIFEQGSLATAMRASASIPGLFAPVEINGKILVDGGVANNLPVDVVKSMDVDYVIAVDITTPLYGPDELDSVIPIIEQLTTLLTFNQQKKQYALLGPEDLLITPDLGDIDTADFDRAGLAIRRGHEAIMAQADKLAKFATSEPVAPRQADDFEPPVIDAIEIRNDSQVSDELIAAQINQKIGEPLDHRQLKRDIESIYGYQYFESVQYEVVEGSAGNELRITTSNPSWGKELLGITFELYTDARAESKYNLGVNLITQGITRKGGEWITGVQFGQDPAIRTEFYLPLDYRQRTFVRPYASYGEESFSRVENDVIVARYNIEETIMGTFLGAEFSNKAILGVGLEKRHGNVDTYLGPDPGKISFDDRIVYGLLEYDTLDSLYFPGRGSFAHIRFDGVDPDIAGVADYDLLTVSLTHAVPLNRHSIVFEGKYQTSNRTFVERHLQPALGGFKNLSGLHKDALVDNNLAYLGVTWLYQLNEGSLFQLGLPLYLGVSIERGNVWADRKDMRLDDMILSGLLMLGVDTPLGPVYVGYGKAEAHESAFYLQLGHLF